MAGSGPDLRQPNCPNAAGLLLSQAGIVIFIMGMLRLWWGHDIAAVSDTLLFQWAGWFVTAGWLTHRFRANPLVKRAWSEVFHPVALLLLMFLGIFLFVGIILLPFVIFVFAKLL